ncbi:hypothetical protein [Endozoicomonas sp. 8E]|nr:hypothetical protein [Endozoicomonas sp. 8E]WOG27421.1 hypothetical protein P6910_23185 [Endozoicomonas sp. 8E]
MSKDVFDILFCNTGSQGQAIAKYMGNRDNIKYYAQELKENT